MHVDGHTTSYTLHSIQYLTLLCLAPLQSFLALPLLFLCFDPRPQCTSRTDHTLHYNLYTLPPAKHQHPSATFTLQTPVLNLTPIFSSYSSSSIAFSYVLTLAPNARPWTDQGGIEPHRHTIATWYISLKNDRGGHQN